MSALKLENAEQRVRAEDAVEIIDCGPASERTRGSFIPTIGVEGSQGPWIYAWIF
jgi:hypothetical protein